MAFDNTNHGVLFRHDAKAPGSKQPDWKGKLNVAGKEYEVAGWVREGARGEFISLSIQLAGAWRDRAGGAQHPDDSDLDAAMPLRSDYGDRR